MIQRNAPLLDGDEAPEDGRRQVEAGEPGGEADGESPRLQDDCRDSDDVAQREEIEEQHPDAQSGGIFRCRDCVRH